MSPAVKSNRHHAYMVNGSSVYIAPDRVVTRIGMGVVLCRSTYRSKSSVMWRANKCYEIKCYATECYDLRVRDGELCDMSRSGFSDSH